MQHPATPSQKHFSSSWMEYLQMFLNLWKHLISIESLKKVVIPVPGLEESLEGIPNHQQSPQSVTITCLPVYGRINIMSTIMTLKPQTIITGIYSGYLKTITRDRKSTRLNSSHVAISYAVFCLKKKK